jgi:hypothetical protein
MTGFVNGVSLSIFNNILDREKLEKIGRLVLSGKSFSHQVIVRDHGVVSETSFTRLQDLFCKFGLAAWNDEVEHSAGCKVTEKGLRFFAALTKTSSPPPTYAQPAILPPANDTTDDGFTPLTVGG